MGNTQPKNKTGKKVVAQKLEHAKKTGVLSLAEHKLESCPRQVFEIAKLRTLDLSSNNIGALNPNVANLKSLKSLNLENNKLPPGSLNPLGRLPNLQILNCGRNMLGRPTEDNPRLVDALPEQLPKGMKQLKVHGNFLSSVPRPIFTSMLVKLESLDLSNNDIASIPEEIGNLKQLSELKMDFNSIVKTSALVGGALTNLDVCGLE
ncbi:MAG: hypothetical protein SGBAC_002181 [Bacillariaceae sp.]